jgi:demethylsterigmatocystin 6-O-methyltransferase
MLISQANHTFTNSFESHMPCLTKTPQFLADTKYANPSDVMHSAFQIAHQTDLPAFVWALSQPKMVEDFHLWMAAVYSDRPSSWLDAYDLSKHCEGSGPDNVIFVDVAGGIGHQCALLKAKLPQLEGRVILEDLPMVIPQAIPTPGVESVGIDMWQGQPIKG